MDTEKHIHQYLKLLIKEYEDTVLTDEVYKTGVLTAELIHNQYNVAVNQYLKNVTGFELKHVSESDRQYYRGWISSHLTMMLHLARQKQQEQEKNLLLKLQAKLEKEVQHWQRKHERLTQQFAVFKEKLKERRDAMKRKRKR